MTSQVDLTRFLEGTPYAGWTQEALAGDASSRRYLRIHHAGQSVILMDAGPDAVQSTMAFIKIADWLRDMGLAAPQILKADVNEGLVLLEDLGPTDVATYVGENPSNAPVLYAAATDVLIAIERKTPPADLTRMTPEFGAQMLDITLEWYAGTPDETRLAEEMTAALVAHCSPPDYLALRDYHAENLIWRPDLTGHSRVGLLDFQDAFLAPRGYDLVSLLRDIRRDVSKQICTTMVTRFSAETGPLSTAAFATLAVQRNLRILGIFARLARRDGKHRYVAMVPRLWSMIETDVAHPELGALQQVVRQVLPPPNHSRIKELL